MGVPHGNEKVRGQIIVPDGTPEVIPLRFSPMRQTLPDGWRMTLSKARMASLELQARWRGT